MEILLWSIIFVISLAVLVKGADWFLRGAEKMGIAIGLAPFVVGVTLVALGTSLPELFSSIAAVFAQEAEIVAANVMGSNIANILLIVGISAIAARKLAVTKDLIDIDLPLLALASVLGLAVVSDRTITVFESGILLAGYVVYVLYTIFHKDEQDVNTQKEKLLSRKSHVGHAGRIPKRERLKALDILFFAAGAAGLVLGSKFLIDSVIQLSDLFSIATGVIAISAVALGTSLPELVVSVKAALAKKPEIALGNIFGSNIFNILVVLGVPGLISPLHLDEKTFTLGLPVMAVSTLLFIFSGISRRIHIWEGAFYLLLYVIFIGKLFDLI